MTTEIAISVEGLSKAYRIWRDPGARLRAALWNTIAGIAPNCRDRAERHIRPLYRDFFAIHDVSFDVRRGEALGIIGRNGSGKSTLLQIVAGTLHPTSGSVTLNGRVAALLELGSGFNPEFSGRENVFLNASILGLSRSEIEARFDQIAAFADIGDFLDQPVKTYSSGMAVRLAFSVIAHVNADVMIIDEALAVGDVFFLQKCRRFIDDFRQRGTLIFVTHNAADVNALCDRALWLESGHVQLLGRAREVTQAYLASHQISKHASTKPTATAIPEPRTNARGLRDQRQEYLKHTQFRNDLKLFEFDPQSARYGTGTLRITAVHFLDEAGTTLTSTVGGERVALEITVTAAKDVDGVIIGFYLKNRLGQYVFGDNTYLTYRDSPFCIKADASCTARFEFYMPVLPAGPYVVTPAVASGNADDHIQHDWIHDALVMESINNQPQRGLVGIPMEKIAISSDTPVDRLENAMPTFTS